MATASAGETFHQHGHHVQKAHGRRVALAADDSHMSGGMIALMPSEADAKRLAVKGGEAAGELHLTLFYLGDDGSVWTDDQRSELTGVLDALAQLQLAGPVEANIFGAAHWNAGGDSPSWVWSVGDAAPEDDQAPARSGLQLAHSIATQALESVHDHPEIPGQHTPWVAHTCAAYTDDLSLLGEMEKRLGPVTFDRLRVSFGDDDRDTPLTAGAAEKYTDIPLTSTFKAGDVLRRLPTEVEAGVDFVKIQLAWQDAVDSVLGDMDGITAKWHSQIADQVSAVIDSGDLSQLRKISLDTGDADTLLRKRMIDLANDAGGEAEREARDQGAPVKKWTLVGRKTKLLNRTSSAMTSIMADSLVLSARRRALASAGSGRTGDQVAHDVRVHLAELSPAGPREAVGAALTAAQNAGRRAVMEAAPPGEYYASEILDKNTCAKCRKIDGHKFTSLDNAYASYPTGGYRDCLGMLRCRGMVVGRWDQKPFELQTKDLLDESGEEILHNDIDQSYYDGFATKEYIPFADPGSHDYDPDEELSDGQTGQIDWQGLGRYYATQEGEWFGNFERSRDMRRAGNALVGLDTSGHDLLLGEGEPNEYDRSAALGMMMGISRSPKIDSPLMRGSYIAGGNADEIAKAFGVKHMDFSLASFTNSQGVADYFSDPSLHQGEETEGVQVMFTIDPGAQGVLGHAFSPKMKAGDPGHDDDYDEAEEELTKGTDPSVPREVVTGGRFQVKDVTVEGNRINVRLHQQFTYNPGTGGTAS